MNHGDMNHGDMDHGGHDAPGCAMNMLLTTSTENLCILVPQWRITSTWSLWTSLMLIVLMGTSFEAIRELSRRYEVYCTSGGYSPVRLSSRSTSPSSPTGTELRNRHGRRRRQVVKALLYGTQVGVSFLLMLVFMTYNVYVMAAVVVGSVVGYYCFNGDAFGTSSRGMACH